VQKQLSQSPRPDALIQCEKTGLNRVFQYVSNSASGAKSIVMKASFKERRCFPLCPDYRFPSMIHPIVPAQPGRSDSNLSWRYFVHNHATVVNFS
jgi:hypothetical protein